VLCGWHPDPVVATYNRKNKISSDAVHGKILEMGCVLCLFKATLQHRPYRSISDFLEKMQKKNTVRFLPNKTAEKNGLRLQSAHHGISAFIKNYFLQNWAFSWGKEGLIISMLQLPDRLITNISNLLN